MPGHVRERLARCSRASAVRCPRRRARPARGRPAGLACRRRPRRRRGATAARRAGTARGRRAPRAGRSPRRTGSEFGPAERDRARCRRPSPRRDLRDRRRRRARIHGANVSFMRDDHLVGVRPRARRSARPSSTWYGFVRSSVRSLNEPGSPSAALTTTVVGSTRATGPRRRSATCARSGTRRRRGRAARRRAPSRSSAPAARRVRLPARARHPGRGRPRTRQPDSGRGRDAPQLQILRAL